MNGIALDKVEDKTIQSIKWSFTLQVFQKIFFFLGSVVLARLLNPEDFGIAAIALTLDTLTWLVTSLGVNAAIIHYQDNFDERINAAFWLYLVSSSVFFVLQIVAAPLISIFYSEKILVDILRINAVAMFITCLGAVNKTILVKNIEFKKISLLEGSLNILKSLLYITFALFGFGVWSFIYPKIITAIISSISMWKLTGWRPKFKFSFKYWFEMFNYGRNVLASNMIDYLLNNSSYILIGNMVGSKMLGLYTFAYDKSMLVVNNITYPLMMISFPAFSRLQDHKDKLKSAFFKAVKLLSILTFPITIGQIILGHEYITTIFGHKWEKSVTIFQIILVYSMLRSVCQVGTPVLQSIGKPQIALKLNLIYAPIFISSLYLGFKLNNILGLAMASSLVGSLWTIIYISVVIKELGWKISDMIHATGESLLSAIIMGFILFVIKLFLIKIHCSRELILILLLPLGIIIYFMLVRFLFKETYGFITEYVIKFIGKKQIKTPLFNKDEGRDKIEET